MKPRINVVTLAVADLDKSLHFYRNGLGFPSEGILGTEFKGGGSEPAGAMGYFEFENGLIFALYPKSELAKDAKRSSGAPSSTEFSLGYIADTRQEVDDILKKAEQAGATITDKPHERPWGIYSGYFADLDGHLWEVIFNPK